MENLRKSVKTVEFIHSFFHSWDFFVDKSTENLQNASLRWALFLFSQYEKGQTGNLHIHARYACICIFIHS